MSLYLGNNLGNTNAKTLFRDLFMIDADEKEARETRKPSIANTTVNIPEVDPTFNKAYNYKRSGEYKYEDPFPNNSRPLQWSYDGRNLSLLNTLEYNQKPNYPDVITPYPQKIVGQY